MKTSELDYNLPEELIAQKPMEPREAARLLAINRKNKTRAHKRVAHLPDYFSADDVLVLNVTSVLRARLYGRISGTENKREVFLLKQIGEGGWQAMIRGRAKIGDKIIFFQDVSATIVETFEDGTFLVAFSGDPEKFNAFLTEHGHVPVPPYIHSEPNPKDYETIYADPKERRSVAAPTAGFHLTEKLLGQLKSKGVQIESVVLDVGLGTFQPVRTENLEDHKIHGEKIIIGEETAERLNAAKKAGKRIVAVGTTTLRVLESAANGKGVLSAFDGETNLFITPGYKFRFVDALLTNFHLPKSSLLALVSAFIGSVEEAREIYNEAVAEKYRFFSFGDAMWIE